MTNPPETPWAILGGYRGSHAHGTHIDPTEDTEFGTDDIDTMHVVVPPAEYYIGLKTFGSRGTSETKNGPWDDVSYEVRKFVTLLLKGNPNVLSLLWLDPLDDYGYTFSSYSGQQLIQHREMFTRTQRTVTAFIGYAHAQLEAMHRDPTHRAYMGERRRHLAQRFGYDIKHAAHTVRLVRMVCELLTPPHELVVHRPDAKELRTIKRGEWSLKQVMNEVTDGLRRAHILEDKIDWPKYADESIASALCADIVRDVLQDELFSNRDLIG